VLFLERIAPVIEHVDGSSGSIGTAVHRAIEQLVPIIAATPVDDASRARRGAAGVCAAGRGLAPPFAIARANVADHVAARERGTARARGAAPSSRLTRAASLVTAP
jgi:hypothetical protein